MAASGYMDVLAYSELYEEFEVRRFVGAGWGPQQNVEPVWIGQG